MSDTYRPRSSFGPPEDKPPVEWGYPTPQYLKEPDYLDHLARRILDDASSAQAKRSARRKGNIAKIAGGVSSAIALVAAIGVGSQATADSPPVKTLRPPAVSAEPSQGSGEVSTEDLLGFDVNEDGIISESETVTEEDLSLVPLASELNPVLSKPIKSKAELAHDSNPSSPRPFIDETAYSLIEQYNPNFIGAYRTTGGIGINIYSTVQDGHTAPRSEDLGVDPLSIEYAFTVIEAHIHNAPDTPSKHAIIENLQRAKSGDLDLVIPLVIDVSPEAGCLGEGDYQLLEFAHQLCSSIGVAFPFREDAPGSTVRPIIVPMGGVQEPLQSSSYEDKDGGFHIELSEPEVRPSIPAQTVTVSHEFGHALSSIHAMAKTNTYQTGDHDHEVIDWLVGDRQNSSHYDDPTLPSPDIRSKIQVLYGLDKLTPILSRR